MNQPDSEHDIADKLLHKGDYSEAFKIFNGIVCKNPNDIRGWVGIGMYMIMTLQFNEARANFEFIIQQEPNHALAWYGLAQTHYNMGNSYEACKAIDQASSIAPNSSSIQLFRAICYAALGATPEQVCELFKCWGECFSDPITDSSPQFSAPEYNEQNINKKLKIGYVSADLRFHPVAFFMEPVFAKHNKSTCEIYVFNNYSSKDSYSNRIESYVDHWFDIYDKTDDEVYALIKENSIDILIDLSGHTMGNRLSVFARRAAPVQATWLGYMYPTGMKAIDYRITSFKLAPPGLEQSFNEHLFRMTAGAVYAPPLPVNISAEPPMVKNGYPTLISLNHSRKVSDQMLELWRRILLARPLAKLIILTKEITQEKAFENLLPRLEKLDLPLERVFISKEIPLYEFMTLSDVADIQLDTHPISGGTTTLHAIWMGLPIVALSGGSSMSNSSASILNMCKLGEFNTENEDAYFYKVLDLIDNEEKIRNFRANSQKHLQDSPLMDYVGFATELEKSFRLMWINHLLQHKKYLDSSHDIDLMVEHCNETTS